MKHTPFVALGLSLCMSCYDHEDHDHHEDSVPAFDEIEPNDIASEADDFGFLFPGDHFAILGNVRDDSLDPADGFRFTASEPIHVEFRLFADNPFADLAVALYDPLIDETVAIFQTSSNPELGGVDVSQGGLDFHLVIASNIEASDYELELQVFPLGVAAQARTSGGDSPRLTASGHGVARLAISEETQASALVDVFRAYAAGPSALSMLPEIVDHALWIVVDPESNEVTRGSLVLTTHGTWIGIPGGLPE